MMRGTRNRTSSSLRVLIVVASVATLLPAAATLAAEPSLPSTTTSRAGARLCPADHVVPTTRSAPVATPAPDAVAAALLKGPPPSDGAPRPSWLESPPSDMSLGGAWSELPRSPFGAVTAIGVWAGNRMVAIDPASGRTATFDPSMQRWEEHQPIPGESDVPTRLFAGIPTTAWTGDEVILAVDRIEPDGETQVPVHLAFDPATGRWRDVAPSPLADTGSLAWSGGLLIDVTRKRHAAAYDPAADCWLRLPDVPLPEIDDEDREWRERRWTVHSIHSTGDEVLAVVRSGSRIPLGVTSFDAEMWTWDPGPQAPPSSSLNRPVLADGRLWFLFEEPVADRIVDAVYDPATERWEAIDAACPLSSYGAVWTGRLILEPRWARHAYDPVSDACYRTPRGKDRARTAGAEVWTGREFIVWSGAYGDAGRAFADGLVYRPPRSALTAEQAKPMSGKLRRAIEARQRYGFDTDPEVVRAIMRDPWQPASRKFGFPMTAAEESSIWSRSAMASQAGHVQPRLRKLPTFAGLWQDKRSGGDFAIALTEADPEVLSQIDGWMAGRWRLVIVPFTEQDLKQALRRVHRVSNRLDPDATLWAAGVDLSAGGLSLMYDPGDVDRMRARKAELEKALGVPVRITSGRVRDL